MRESDCHQRRLLPGILIWVCVLVPFAGTAQEGQTDWEPLAAYWAPLIAQSTRHEFRTDVLTSFDFDGDWSAANNAQSRYPLPSTVYYWVIETGQHYYIGYAFYHIQDVVGFESEDPKTYAHDMQGIVLALEKSTGQAMGRFMALGAWGSGQTGLYTEHTAFEGADDVAAAWQDNVAFSEDPPEGSGDIDFMLDGHGFHPVVYGEAGHHEIFGEKAQTAFPEGPDLYELNAVTDFRGMTGSADTARGGGRNRGGRRHRPGNAAVSATADGGIPGDDGLIYIYEGVAQEIINARSQGRGTVLHHWNQTGYDLQPLAEFWDRRNDHEGDAEDKVFGAPGVFAADEETGPASRAPWVWGMFFDPAASFAGATDSAGSEAGSSITAASFATVDELAGEHAAQQETAQ